MELSRVIVGCMRRGDKDVKTFQGLIDTAIENGVNYFDHADIYAGGRSEKIFSEALKSNSNINREDIILQSK